MLAAIVKSSALINPVAIMLTFLIAGVSSASQSLEEVVNDWLMDAPNGFHNAFEKYGRDAHGFFHDIDFMISNGWRSIDYAVGFEVRPKESLEQTFQSLESDMAKWELLKGWEKERSVHSSHNITYRRKQGQEMQVVSLALGQNYDASKNWIVLLTIRWNNTRPPKKNVPDKLSMPDPSSGLVTSILGRLKKEQARDAFLHLVGDADNDFKNIIIHESLENGIYRVQPNYLNPKAPVPFVQVEERARIRRLVIRFVQPDENKAQYTFLDACDALGMNELLEKDWRIEAGDAWKAHSKSGTHKKCYKGVDRQGDFFVLEVTKKDYRNDTIGILNEGQKRLLDAFKAEIIPRLKAEGYSVVRAVYLNVGTTPEVLDWKVHGGNHYACIALASDRVTPLQMALKQEVPGSVLTGADSVVKTVIEGKVSDGHAELMPDATKIMAWPNFLLEIRKSGGSAGECPVCILIAYKSRDNATGSASGNKSESFYSEQGEEELKRLEEQVFRDLNSTLDKTRELLQELEADQ